MFFRWLDRTQTMFLSTERKIIWFIHFFHLKYLKENVWQLKFPSSKRHIQIWRSTVPTSSSKPFFRENLFPSLAITNLILNEASMQYFISYYMRTSTFCLEFKMEIKYSGIFFLLLKNRTITPYAHLILWIGGGGSQVPALTNCSLRHIDIKQCD